MQNLVMQAGAFYSSKRLIDAVASLVTPFNYLYCDTDRVWCCASFLPEALEVIAILRFCYHLFWIWLFFSCAFSLICKAEKKIFPVNINQITVISISRKLCMALDIGVQEPGGFISDRTHILVMCRRPVCVERQGTDKESANSIHAGVCTHPKAIDHNDYVQVRSRALESSLSLK